MDRMFYDEINYIISRIIIIIMQYILNICSIRSPINTKPLK